MGIGDVDISGDLHLHFITYDIRNSSRVVVC